MPIITPEEIGTLIPALKGNLGTRVSKLLFSILSMNKLNDAYDEVADHTGEDFAQKFLEHRGIDYQIGNSERLFHLPEGPFITISNHPYGHLDGVMLIDMFGHFRHDYKVMVNTILGLIKALEPNFITVIPTGKERTAPKAESISGIKATIGHIREGGAVGIFPSGAVSDLSLKDKCVRDRQWQEAAIKLIKKAEVPIVPVRFFDGNSNFYYLLGLIHYMVRLLRLPAEALNKGGSTVRLGIGQTIDVEKQKACRNLDEFSAMLRASVYGMEMPESFTYRSELKI